MTASNEPVLTTIDEHVAYITLNVPEKRNSFTDRMLYALLETLESVSSNENTRVLVIQGAAKNVSVGCDLDEFSAGEFHAPDVPNEQSTAKLRCFMRVSQYLRDAPQITIAATDGACAGAGLSLAAACDLRVSS